MAEAKTKTKRFEVHEGVNRLELNLTESDKTLVLTAGKVYETGEPSEIAALSDHPSVKRAPNAPARKPAAKADAGGNGKEG